MQRRLTFNWRPILVGLFITPALYLLILSLAGTWRFPDVIPVQWTITHWLDLIRNENGLLQSLATSILISCVVAFLATGSGFIVSRAIARHRRKNKLILFSYFPFVFSPVIFASVLNFYFIWLGLSGGIVGVILAQLFITFPFAILLFVDYWDIKLKSYEELVYTLGGNEWQAMMRVMLPVSKNMLLLCFFQTFLTSWFEYGLTSVIGVGKIQTLTIKVYEFINEANPYYAAVSSCLLILPPSILLALNKKYLFNTKK